eukprot:g117.t1
MQEGGSAALNRRDFSNSRKRSRSRQAKRSDFFLTRKRLVDIGELPLQEISERRHVSQSGELHIIIQIIKDNSVQFLLRGLAARALGNLMLDEYVRDLVRTDKDIMASLVQLVASEPTTGHRTEMSTEEKVSHDKADIAVVKVHCYFLISMILHWSDQPPKRPDTHGRSRTFNLGQKDEMVINDMRPMTATSQLSFLQSISQVASSEDHFSMRSDGRALYSDRPQSQGSMSRRFSFASGGVGGSFTKDSTMDMNVLGRPRTTGTNVFRSDSGQHQRGLGNTAGGLRARTPASALLEHDNFQSKQQGFRSLLNVNRLSNATEIDSTISRISLPAAFGSTDTARLVADIHRPSTAEMISVGLSTPPHGLEGFESDMNISTSKNFFSALGSATNRILLSRGRSRGRSRGSLIAVHPTIEERPRRKNHVPGKSALFFNLPFTYPRTLPERFLPLNQKNRNYITKEKRSRQKSRYDSVASSDTTDIRGMIVPQMLIPNDKVNINLGSLHDLINWKGSGDRNIMQFDFPVVMEDTFVSSHKEQVEIQNANEKQMLDDALMIPSKFLEQKGAYSMARRRAALDLYNINQIFFKRLLRFGLDSWKQWSHIYAEKQVLIRTGIYTISHVMYRHELMMQWSCFRMLEKHARIAREIEELRAVLRIQTIFRNFRRNRRNIAATVCQRWYRQRKKIIAFYLGVLAFLDAHRKARQIQHWFINLMHNWKFVSAVRLALARLRTATIRIQRWYVNYESSRLFRLMVQKAMDKRNRARLVIQSLGRMIIAKKIIKARRAEFVILERAALRLQVFIRNSQGAFSTHLLLRALHYSDIDEYKNDRRDAATTMQRFVRGFFGRKIFRLKALYRRTDIRASNRIRDFWKLMLLRKESAIRIQALVRGVQTRKITDHMLKLYRYKHQCSRVIQRAWLQTAAIEGQGLDGVLTKLRDDYFQTKRVPVSKLLLRLRLKNLKAKTIREVRFFGRFERSALDIQWAWSEYKKRCRWLRLQREALKRERQEEGRRAIERISMAQEDKLSRKYADDLFKYNASTTISSFTRGILSGPYVARITVQTTLEKLILSIGVFHDMRLTEKSANMIQNAYRICLARRIYRRLQLAVEMKRKERERRLEDERMRLKRLAENRLKYAIMLQQLVRRHQSSKELRRRRKGLLYASANRFSKIKQCKDVFSALSEALFSTRGYDPEKGDAVGMGIFLWLFRLGCSQVVLILDEYNELQSKKGKPIITRPDHLAALLRNEESRRGRVRFLKDLGVTRREDIDHILAMLFPLDPKHKEISHLFKRIAQRMHVEQMFLNAYPTYGGRAKKFKHHLPVYPPDRCAPAVDYAVSNVQLKRYLSLHKGKSMTALKRVEDLIPKCTCGDTYKDCICGGRQILNDIQFEHRRKAMSRELYTSALKQLASIVGGRPLPKDLDDGSGMLHNLIKSTKFGADSLPDPEKAIQEMHKTLSTIQKYDTAVRAIQRVFRGKVGRGKAYIRRIDVAYQRERTENRVLKFWKEEKLQEEKEYNLKQKKEWEAQEKQYVDELIANIPRYGWVLIPERFGDSYYWNKFTKEKVWDCPVYSYEEFTIARKLQSIFRGRRFRKVAEQWKDKNMNAAQRIDEASKLLAFVDTQTYEESYEDTYGDQSQDFSSLFSSNKNRPQLAEAFQRIAPEISRVTFDGLPSNSVLNKKSKCSRCRDEDADRFCIDCKKYYCFHCFTAIHERRGTSLSKHRSQMIQAFDLSSSASESTLCHNCNAKPGTRFCLGCDDVSKKIYCDVCFQICHQCADCGRKAAVAYCESCKSEYCESCFVHFHSKGNRKKHVMKASTHGWVGFSSKVPSFCSECLPEKYIVATTFCESCDDAFCGECCEDFHSRGNRKTHEHRLLGTKPSAPPRPILTKTSQHHFAPTPNSVFISVQQPANTGSQRLTNLSVYIRTATDENQDSNPFLPENVALTTTALRSIEGQVKQRRETKIVAQKALTTAIETSSDQQWINNARKDLKNAEKRVIELLSTYSKEKATVENLTKYAFRKCETIEYTGISTVVELAQLQPDTVYQVRVTASNVNGEGPMSSHLAFRTKELISLAE